MNFLKYVSDKSKFYDSRSGQSISLDTAKQRLRAYDSKYYDEASLNQAVRDIMDHPVTASDLKKSSGPNLAEVWNSLEPLIRLKKQINNAGQSQIFYVSHGNEVSKIDYTDDQALIDALLVRTEDFAVIRQFYEQSPECDKVRKSTGFLPFLRRMLAEFWHADERTILSAEPLQISWDSSELAYKQMNAALLVPGETPTWAEFTSRLDYPNVFMAWVWSIFEPTNNIRQVLWLKGAGNDGKSSVQKAIESVIGKQYCYSMKPGDESQQWFQRNVYGKVLVNYADCRNSALIDFNNIKQLTGGDTTSIEGKGENSFTGKIYSKLLVTSNVLPKINPELQAHTSRLIKLEVAPQSDNRKDFGFEKRLQAEIYHFLYACREHFASLVSKGGERLILPKSLEESIKVECASETYLNVQDFVEEFVVFGDFTCLPAELRKASKHYFLHTKCISSDALRHHENELNAKLYLKGCGQSRSDTPSGKVTMWRGFRLRTPAEGIRIIG